jgi:hypothetical protein
MERRLWWSVRTCEEGKERTMKYDTRALAWYSAVRDGPKRGGDASTRWSGNESAMHS